MKNQVNKNKVRNLKTTEKTKDPVVESKVRMEALAKAIFETCKEVTEKHGDFSIHELLDVMIKVQHSYNKRFLDQDHAQMMKQQNPDKK